MKWVVVSASFAIVALVALTLALSFRAADQRDLDRVVRSTNEALCAFKKDLEQRAEGTRELLRATGRDGFVFDPAELSRTLENQEAALESLAALKC